MTDEQLVKAASDFLVAKGIRFVPDAKIILASELKSEVVFLVPEALDSTSVVDPPDVRVVVDRQTGSCELLPQM